MAQTYDKIVHLSLFAPCFVLFDKAYLLNLMEALGGLEPSTLRLTAACSAN